MYLFSFFYYLVAPLSLLMGFQIQARELRLLTGHYNYRIQAAQYVSFTAAILALAGTAYFLFQGWSILSVYPSDSHDASALLGLAERTVLPLFIFVVAEWGLSLLNPSTAWSAWSFRLLLCVMLELSSLASPFPFITYVAVGAFLRNSPFGIPYVKALSLAHHLQRRLTTGFEEMHYLDEAEGALLPDTQFAGSRRSADDTPRKRFDVTEAGIKPNSQSDNSEALQRLIDRVGDEGGGIIYFPRGRYMFNTSGHDFIQINHSHVVLEGEVGADGIPLATLVNCSCTSRGHKNPWISPFFITTGEALQPSNEFWGLQFRKRNAGIVRSNSLSDPGSDGSIITPDITTRITAAARKGSTVLSVDDARAVGKYILVGLYNTTPDGALICDILGETALRPEWTVANRAGVEEAPSYQWLVEVHRIVDDNTIELVRPLLRDIDLCCDPVVCNVQLLEGIVVRNLCLDSCWNGQFRHHGFPLYYNIPRTQEMDYGWNGINLKRCAHSEVTNVRIRNFTNPLYILDSRSVTISHVDISGHDGHQGLKAYMHTCDCLFEYITFRAHFADMMGGEGPAYANLFRRVEYLNPVFHPVDYDFHGFASEPMSPPSDNMFTQILGFRYFKSAGSVTHIPSLGRNNTWWNIKTEGERRGDYLFYAMPYREKRGIMRWVYAVGHAVAMVQKTHSLTSFIHDVRQKLKSIDEMGHKRKEHRRLFFHDSHVSGIRTQGILTMLAIAFLLPLASLRSPLSASPITCLSCRAQCLLWEAPENLTPSDLKNLRQSADAFASMPPVAVTDKAATRSGNRHNFEGLSIYCWPDPANPNGPYIIRDGEPNPEYKDYDLPRLEELVKRTRAFSRAYYATGDERYYEAFCRQIDTWFLNRKTRMVPDFEYNQFIPGQGGGKGNAAGIIDAYNFVNVLEAVRLVETKKPIGRARSKKLKRWFRHFATWMQTSALGRQEARATNNHGAAYDITLFVISHYIGLGGVCEDIVTEFAERRINPQIMADGTQPEELKRTKAFNYSVYNLQHLVDFCIIQRNLGNDYINGEGRRIRKAIEYLDQFVGHRELFPYQEIGDWEQQERNVQVLKSKVGTSKK